MVPVYKLIAAALSVVALGTTASCQSTTSGGVVGAERKQLLLVSSEQLNQMAVKAYAQIQNESAKKGMLNTDPALTRRVRAIASRITPQTRVFRADAPAWKWEVNVINSKELNAFCMPGGKIAFYTGILDKLKLSDDEAAMIMGHEMAHALREHARSRVAKTNATGIGLSIAAQLLGLGQLGDVAANLGTQLLSLKYSRDDETEADLVGLELAARSAYQPRAAVTLWQKMAAAGSGAAPGFLSTHPSGPDRIRQLEANVPKVQGLYERARKG